MNISEVNRQAIYRTRSAGPNISQYIGSTRQTYNKLHFIAMHCSISHCRVKEKALVATTIYIYDLFPTSPFSFTFCCAHSTHTSKRYPATNLQPTSAQITWLKVLLIRRRFLTIICINSGLCSQQDYFPAGNGDHFGSIILDFFALLCQKQCACFNSTVRCSIPVSYTHLTLPTTPYV